MARFLDGYTVNTAKQATSVKQLLDAAASTWKNQNSEFTSNASKNGAAQRAAQAAVTAKVPLLARDGTPLSGATNNGRVVGEITAALDKLSSSSGSGSGQGSGGGYGGGGVGQFPTAEEEDPYDKIINMIKETSAANNEWSAQQAQKQMDFQKMMSDTAHQREVADLQKAGLNPVLSAGGNGASTPSGAMGDTDTSNTRLIAEVAMEALNAVQNTAAGAVGVARRVTKNNDNSLLGRLSSAYANNRLFRTAVNTGMNIVSSAARYGLVRAILR